MSVVAAWTRMAFGFGRHHPKRHRQPPAMSHSPRAMSRDGYRYIEYLDQMLHSFDMRSIILPTGFHPEQSSLYALARDSGLAWDTVRTVLDGTGTIASLSRLRGALGLRWSWTGESDAKAIGKALAVRRQSRRISQRSMASKLAISPQTVVTLETRFKGRIETLRRYLRVVELTSVLSTPPKRLVPAGNEAAADRVFTPGALAGQIITAFNDISGTVLEPARGDGAFYDALPNHVTRHWCEIDDGHDFFDWTTPVDWIVTNPPWSRFRDFLEHSLRVADNVLFLAPVNHFTTKRRVALIRDAGFGLRHMLFVPPPAAWPASGFQLAAVHLQREWLGLAKLDYLD